jgi:hypothetical protein
MSIGELQRRFTVNKPWQPRPAYQKDFLGFQRKPRPPLQQRSRHPASDAVTAAAREHFVDYGAPLPTTGDPETFDRVLAAKQAEVSMYS